MKLLCISIFVTLFSLTLTKESTFRGDEKIIGRLAQKLTKEECWVVGNYLAQKSLKPFPAQAKMLKIGGHAKDFNCLAGLNLWTSTLLPPMIEKVEQKELHVSLAQNVSPLLDFKLCFLHY